MVVGNMQEKAKNGYKEAKHKNYYKSYLWQEGCMKSFIQELLCRYHREKLA